MNTFHAQSFASDKLVFGEEEDLFNTTTYFNQGYKDFVSNDNLFQEPSVVGMDFENKKCDDILGMKQSTPFDLTLKAGDVSNDSCQADFGMSANSFHFHFDRFSNEISGHQETSKNVGRTETGILFQIDQNDELINCANSADDSTYAKRTTSYSNCDDKQTAEVLPEKQVVVSATKKASFDESLTKTSESSKAADALRMKTMDKKVSAKDDTDLSSRRDVVNKTVLRVMRRFFMQKFKDAFPKKFRSKEAKSKWYFEYIKKLTVLLFGEDNAHLRTLQTTMAAIINPKHMTAADIAETGLAKDDFLTFYNTIYKYSHTRLASLFKVDALEIGRAHV